MKSDELFWTMQVLVYFWIFFFCIIWRIRFENQLGNYLVYVKCGLFKNIQIIRLVSRFLIQLTKYAPLLIFVKRRFFEEEKMRS